MTPHRPPYVRTHLLAIAPDAVDLDAVRAAADRRGWDVELQRLDGSPWVPASGARLPFPEPARLLLRARPGADEPDAAAILRSSPGLALDDLGRRPDS